MSQANRALPFPLYRTGKFDMLRTAPFSLAGHDRPGAVRNARVFATADLAAGGVLMGAWWNRSEPVTAPPRAAALPGGWQRESLDLLRIDAALGDSEASAALVRRLLDRFEQDGGRDDLHEAVHWTARDWDQPAYLRGEVVQRLVRFHCRDAVLQWHWLCVQGE